MKRKRFNIRFTNKSYSHRGIVSLILSFLSLSWMIYAISRTFMLGENSGNVLGGVGTLALVLQIAAIVAAVQAMHEENVFKGMPKIAAAFAVLMLLLWAAVYVLGIGVLLEL